MANVKKIKLLMVVAKKGFRDEEFFVPYNYFKSKGIDIEIASTEKGECLGKLGAKINADKSFSEAFQKIMQNQNEYDGIVIVGGPGSKDLVGNKDLIKILTEMKNKNKLISAICYAPVILAKSGILKGKKATVWNSDGVQEKIFNENYVTYLSDSVVVDTNFITANGPEAAEEFAIKIVNYFNL